MLADLTRQFLCMVHVVQGVMTGVVFFYQARADTAGGNSLEVSCFALCLSCMHVSMQLSSYKRMPGTKHQHG